jgi:starch-binding outer membrane protein, SusD/RagB family
MKFIRKIWILSLTVPVLVLQLGCKKFLDRKPLGQAVAGDVQQGGVESQVFGLYASLQNWGMTQLPFLTMHAARADDDVNSTRPDGGDQQDIADRFLYAKDHWSLNSLWTDHMAFITQASGIIHDVDSAYANDPASQINKAEASFLRAYAYFDMVRDYGEVPIINFKVYQASDANVPKKSVTEVYALIDNDLNFAEQYLPESWSSSFLGRLTKGAAKALHAKTYLYRQNWTSALAKCDEVIASNKYSLYSDYGKLFSESAENSTESIFAIQNYESANGSVVSSNYLPNYQGVRGDGQWDLGWGWNLPSQGLADTAYEAGDPRRTATILYAGKPDSLYGATVPPFAGYTANTNNWPFWNKKVYSDPVRRAATGDRFGNWLNTMILRYADVLLMDAEAANEIGGTSNIQKALDNLELVRARARSSYPANPSALPKITNTNQAVIRKAIKQERRVEFAMEFERFYDLVRWIPASDGIDAIGVLGPLGYTAKNKYYPVPQPEVDKSNGVLKQNPDY